MESHRSLPTAGRFIRIETCPLPALISFPDGYVANSDHVWPLILFLHGRGECGSDLTRVLCDGLPRYIAHASQVPFFVLAPQCPAGTDWSAHHTALVTMLEQVVEVYQVDPHRIYLTGLSMGGRGTWQLAVEHAHRFAAIAPICGRTPDMPDFFERLAGLQTMPVWVFHGAKDPIVPVSHSDRIVAALGGTGRNVRYTVYPEADHDAWSVTYTNPELYSWFLTHHRW